MSRIKLYDLTKRFKDGEEGDIVAVNDLSVEIEDGEFVVFVGPSGCGKTTTLRMIAGLEKPSEGTVLLDDEDITDQPPQQRNVAMVFQSYALYPHMTVRRNMSFGLEQSTNLPSSEIQSRVEETSSMLGIESMLDRRPGELSGGQQQRVALGRAIVREPAAFLMDEPLSNLDAKLRSQMRTELLQLQDQLDVTTIYVTHDQTEAMTMGDRIVILRDGELQQVDTPDRCYHQPNNTFVAGFLGEPSMNFLELSLENGSLVGEHITYPLPPKVNVSATDLKGKELKLGIRPEDLEINPQTENEHTISGTVTVVESLGNEQNLHIDISDSSMGAKLVASVDNRAETFQSGERVDAHIPPGRIHLFDNDTGEAIHNQSLGPVSEPEVQQ